MLNEYCLLNLTNIAIILLFCEYIPFKASKLNVVNE